ncbi:MAG TPA: DUF4810 domain-containing protein [Herbaspirillum sp.]|jgi:hypothetical protein
MQLIKLAAAAGLGIAFLTGCAMQHPSHYAWGDYDGSLYSYYKDPTKSTAYMEALSEIVTQADTAQKAIAPGLYAEYGYMLLQQKKTDEAIVYFSKEKQAWPESGYFMDGMIKNAQMAGTQKDAAAIPVDAAGPMLSKSAVAETKE